MGAAMPLTIAVPESLDVGQAAAGKIQVVIRTLAGLEIVKCFAAAPGGIRPCKQP